MKKGFGLMLSVIVTLMLIVGSVYAYYGWHHTFTFVIEEGTVLSSDWDVFTLPDPRVCLYIDGETCCTGTDYDTRYPVWYKTCHFTINSDSTWGMKLSDRDVFEDDTICVWSKHPITIVDILNGGKTFICSNGYVKVDIDWW